RCSCQQGWIEEDLGLVYSHWLDHADLYADKDQIGKHQQMRTTCGEQLLRPGLPVPGNQGILIHLSRRCSRYERAQAGTVGCIVGAKIDHHVTISQVPGLSRRLTGP